jgi:hypothetical protein
MTTYNWEETYNHACQTFGQRPRAEDEQTVLDVFERNPRLVTNSIDEIAANLQTNGGQIRWGWSALAKRIQHAPARNVTVTDTNDKEAATAAAERWIANAGIHYDRWEEVRDELFGDFSFSGRHTLKPWRNDETLVDRIRRSWETHRPTGEQLETDATTRGKKWRTDRQRVQAVAAKTKADRETRAAAELETALRPPPAEEPT